MTPMAHAGKSAVYRCAGRIFAQRAIATLTGISGCEGTYDDPEIWRAAPGLVVVSGERVHREVRGCVFDDSIDIIDDGLDFILAVNAEVESQSEGTAQLAMTYEMVGDEYDEYGMNVERTSVTGGNASILTEDHVFFELPILLDAGDRRDACSDWKSVDFLWESSGQAPLRVTWEVGFAVEIQQGADLGIDFRSFLDE